MPPGGTRGATSRSATSDGAKARTRRTLVALFVAGSVAFLAVALLAAPGRSAPPSYGPAPTRTDMTLSLVVGVALLVAWVGCGIFIFDRARRRRASANGGAQRGRNE